MSRPATHWAERIYGVLVALYPRDFRVRYGPAMRLALRDMLEDSEMPAWRIWFSVLRDLRGSFLHEHLANLTGGISMTRTGIVAGLARVAMLTVLIGTPLATGAVGYYLGRSQVSPVAEPGPFPRLPAVYTFETGSQNRLLDLHAIQRLIKDRIKDSAGENGR